MTQSDVIQFWKLLADAKFTGRPSSLTEDEVRQMANAKGWAEHEIEAALSGQRESRKQRG